MSNKQQTAVEQLFEVLWDLPKDKFAWHNALEKAKEMEKGQMIDDYVNGMHKGQEIYFNHQIKLDVNSINYSTTIAEHYYNETYGDNK